MNMFLCLLSVTTSLQTLTPLRHICSTHTHTHTPTHTHQTPTPHNTQTHPIHPPPHTCSTHPHAHTHTHTHEHTHTHTDTQTHTHACAFLCMYFPWMFGVCCSNYHQGELYLYYLQVPDAFFWI